MEIQETVNGIPVYRHYKKLYIPLDSLTEEMKSQLFPQTPELIDEFGELLEKIKTIRNGYKINKNNKYLPVFIEHKDLIYKSIASRLKKQETKEDWIRTGFRSLQDCENLSLFEFLYLCGVAPQKALLDFIYIVNKNIISSHTKEAAGAKKLAKWLEEGKFLASDIQPAYEWMREKKKYLTPSLTSLIMVISDFLQQSKETKVINKNVDALIEEKLNEY